MNDSFVATFLELLHYTQSKRLQITCPKSERFGKPENKSGWYVCVAEPFNLVKPCLVYSFGMGRPKYWSFDEVVTKKYGCQDMAYDPTTGRRTSKVGERMWFFNVGLSGKDGTLKKKWSVKTLETLLKETKHIDATIDILKIDIECSEWSAFDAILASRKCLSKVKQLLVEFHPCGTRNAKTSQDLIGYWRTLREIDRLGFKLWRAWDNLACKFRSKRVPGAVFYGCFNAYYLNVNYLV